MNLLVERSADPKLPSVNTLNTFFYPKLCSSGYSAVRRWTKKMDIFSKDILLVPVHLGVHWCLSVSINSSFASRNLWCCFCLPNIFSLSVGPGGGFPEEVGPVLWFNGWKQRWSVSEVVVSPETCVCIGPFFMRCVTRGNCYYSHSDYLQQESKDKKGKEMDTSGWTLHSKKRNVSHVRFYNYRESHFRDKITFKHINNRCWTTVGVKHSWTSLAPSGNPTADERKWLWNVHLQICRLHYQRQANHIHAGKQCAAQTQHQIEQQSRTLPLLLFPETHALLQKKDGLGDCEPETVVMRRELIFDDSSNKKKEELDKNNGATFDRTDLLTSSQDQESLPLRRPRRSGDHTPWQCSVWRWSWVYMRCYRSWS